MKMYFHFGFGDQFLFKDLHIDSTLQMWTICGILFLVSILYEYIKYIRVVRCGCQINKHCVVTETGDSQHNENRYVGSLRTRRHRLIQTVLHTVQTIISIIIMLSIMSFNLCIIFAILVGKLLFL